MSCTIRSIASIVFESYLFALTISRYRRAQLDGMANFDLMSVLVRDGVLAFAVIFGTFLWSSDTNPQQSNLDPVAMVANAILFTISSGQNALTTAGFP